MVTRIAGLSGHLEPGLLEREGPSADGCRESGHATAGCVEIPNTTVLVAGSETLWPLNHRRAPDVPGVVRSVPQREVGEKPIDPSGIPPSGRRSMTHTL